MFELAHFLAALHAGSSIFLAIGVSLAIPDIAALERSSSGPPSSYTPALQFNDTGGSGSGDRNSMYLPLI